MPKKLTVLTQHQRDSQKRADSRVIVWLPSSAHEAVNAHEVAGRVGISYERARVILVRLVGLGRVKRVRFRSDSNSGQPAWHYYLVTSSTRSSRDLDQRDARDSRPLYDSRDVGAAC